MTSITSASDQPTPKTAREEAFDRYSEAINASSIPGEICKIVGSLGALAGGALMGLSVLTGNGGAFLVSGGIAVAAAAAGAPIAAIGSIATQTKRNTKLSELDAWMKQHSVY